MTKLNLDRRGWLILGGVGCFVLAVFAAVALQRAWKQHIGPDNCVYTDKKFLTRAPADQAVLLIDQSEALTPGHVRGVTKKIEELILDDNEFPTGSRLLVFTFSKDDFPDRGGPAPSFKPVMDLCKPKAEGNPLSENNRRIRERFLRKFQEPFQRLLEEELGKEIGARSPILETFQMISRSQDVEPWNRRKSLVVISDLLQHTQGFSHYRIPNGYEHFLKIYAAQVRSDWRNWDVVVLYLRRYKDRALQREAHLDFWQRYFHDAGTSIKKLEGLD